MKPQTESLRRQLYNLLVDHGKHMTISDIVTVVNEPRRETRNTLNCMLKDKGNYPELWRFRCKEGKTWYSTVDGDEPNRAQHPIMGDLWRGWGTADRLGDGNADVFMRSLKYEP